MPVLPPLPLLPPLDLSDSISTLPSRPAGPRPAPPSTTDRTTSRHARNVSSTSTSSTSYTSSIFSSSPRPDSSIVSTPTRSNTPKLASDAGTPPSRSISRPTSTRSKNDIFSTPSKEWFVRPAAAPETPTPLTGHAVGDGVRERHSGDGEVEDGGREGRRMDLGGLEDAGRAGESSSRFTRSGSTSSCHRRADSETVHGEGSPSLHGSGRSRTVQAGESSGPRGAQDMRDRTRSRTNTLDVTSEETDRPTRFVSDPGSERGDHTRSQARTQPPGTKPTLPPVFTRAPVRSTAAIAGPEGMAMRPRRSSASTSPSPPNTSIITPTSPTQLDGLQRALDRVGEEEGAELQDKEERISWDRSNGRSDDSPQDNGSDVEVEFSRDGKGRIHSRTLLGQGRHGAVYLARYYKRERVRHWEVPEERGERQVWHTCAAKVFDPDDGGCAEAAQEASMLSYLHASDETRGSEAPLGSRARRELDYGRRVIVGYFGLTAERVMDSPESGRAGENRRGADTTDQSISFPSGAEAGRRASQMTRVRREWHVYEKNGQQNDYTRFLLSQAESPILRNVLALEYCPNGTVEQFIAKGVQRMEPGLWKRWYKQGEEALRWCHAKHVVHCDVKPGNLLLDECFNIRLSDFNSALMIDPHRPPRDGAGRGTLAYASPEIVDPSPDHTFSFDTDLWSFGVSMWHCLTGLEPYGGMRAVETIYHVRKGKFWDWAQGRMMQEEARLMELGNGRTGADLHRGGSLRVGTNKAYEEDQRLNLRRSSLSGERLAQRYLAEADFGYVGSAGRDHATQWASKGELLEAIWHLTKPWKRTFVELSANT